MARSQQHSGEVVSLCAFASLHRLDSRVTQVEAASVTHKHAAEAEALRQELSTARAQLSAAETARAHAEAAAAQASASHDPAPALQVRAEASPASNTRAER